MVWSCMSTQGVNVVVFVDNIMDKKVYLEILKDNSKKSAKNTGIPDDFKFYQDKDHKHIAYNVQLWLMYNCRKVGNPPPQSPDLTPIENLWD